MTESTDHVLASNPWENPGEMVYCSCGLWFCPKTNWERHATQDQVFGHSPAYWHGLGMYLALKAFGVNVPLRVYGTAEDCHNGIQTGVLVWKLENGS